VQFRPFNLLHEFTYLGRFDLVFCRNVLIYFDPATKSRVLDRIAQIMPPDGFLVLGAAETVVGLTRSFQPVLDRRGLYVPAAAVADRDAPFARFRPRLAVVSGAR
jgi:chemotaxis protein methyltransferase CheR